MFKRAEANAISHVVMDRDRRLTGFLRGQTDNPRAPAGFELSNGWRVRSLTWGFRMCAYTDVLTGRESVHLEQGARKQSCTYLIIHELQGILPFRRKVSA